MIDISILIRIGSDICICIRIYIGIDIGIGIGIDICAHPKLENCVYVGVIVMDGISQPHMNMAVSSYVPSSTQ